MTLPESKIRVGVAYRETILLVLSIRPVQMKSELRRFYRHFSDYISFPERNIDHYGLMIRKLVKSQAIYYERNRPVLTIKGKEIVQDILESQSVDFQRKWNAYVEMRH